MPELPEVEHLRLTLAPLLHGRRIKRVLVHRPDVVRAGSRIAADALPRLLLEGRRVAELRRRGKQLAIIAEDGAVLLVQLGMTGQVVYVGAGAQPRRGDHVHITWLLDGQPDGERVIFRDARRFGALTPFESLEAVQAGPWSRLGPDALAISQRELKPALAGTRRAIKAALLDQAVLAGVGNIYADESLIRAEIHPLCPASDLDAVQVRRLAQAIRTTLRRSISAGGTTLRDYVDGNGRGGRNRPDLLAYARAGEPCRGCGEALLHLVVAQRTTTFCPRCQPLRPSTSYPHAPARGRTLRTRPTGSAAGRAGRGAKTRIG